MAAAGHKDGVLGSGQFHSKPDGFVTGVGLDKFAVQSFLLNGGTGPGEDIRTDGGCVFVVGVIVSDDDYVRESRGDRSHGGPLALVPLPGGSEDHNDP